MKIQSILQSQCLSLTLLVAINSPTHAAPGDISDTPLFTSNNAQPNVFFEVDDSGSMDWEFLNVNHWHRCTYDWIDNNCVFWVTEGTPVLPIGTPVVPGTVGWAYFGYIYDNTDNAYTNVCVPSLAGDAATIGSCPITTATYDWRNLSSSFNVIYYNPDSTYEPWENGDGTAMSDAVFSAARSDPQSGKTGYTNTENLSGFEYHVWSDTHGYSGNNPTGFTTNKTSGANGLMDWWDEHLKYTVNASSIVVEHITYTGTNGNTETVNSTTTLTGTGSHALLGNKTIAEVQQNIANWYQYYRKRSFVTKSAIASVVSDNTDFRYGLNFINNSSFTYNGSTTSFVEVPSGTGSTSTNSLLLDGLFNLVWPNFGTPLRQGLERAGNYFDNSDGRTDPVNNSCQQNYTVLFTDGYWNGNDPTASIGDADADSYNLTVADVAKYFYDLDLSSLDDDVVPNQFDTATHQHMVTYSVAFGVQGNLTDTDNDGWPGNDPGLSEADDWGDPYNSTPAKIDDLWHASFNSKGTFVSASTPEEVSNSLSDALANINDRAGSAASVAFNTTTLTGSSSVYLAQFNSTNSKWSGDLLSFALDPHNGNVNSTPSWSAASILDSDPDPVNNRTIFTYNGTQGVPFLWANLTTAQQADLKINPDGSSAIDLKAQARLNFLRGDRTNEKGAGGTYSFRNRSKLLGDIIHSDPIYVGTPQLYWPGESPFPDTLGTDTYEDFKTGSAYSRTPIIYVGANDGMLHGFNSSTGAEVMAYIPGHLFSSASTTEGLHFLTDPNYAHRYYVDMPVAVSDIYIDKADSIDENSDGTNLDWHTILIGGGRAGSRGIFALDITDPTEFIEDSTHADKLVLWEFDSNDDADLGYTFSKPVIGMLNNDRWAAIFGNGYNNSGDGQAKLFILFLDGGLDGTWTAGTDYLEISTGVGSIVSSDCTNASSVCNGLSTPQAVDMDGDKIIDRVYAGDLKGNLWAFDLTGSNTGNWNIAHKQGPNYKPLFTATHHDTLTPGTAPAQISALAQPIMNKPILVKHPDGLGGDPDVLVFFGTGQYLNSSDITDNSVQTFYGIWDNGDHSLTPANLIEQSFLSGTFMNNGNDISSLVRIISDESVDYSGADKGWFINLTASSGERIIVDSDVRGDYVFFNTWIPDANPCNAGGEGYLMIVKQSTGGRPDSAVFDLDGDGSVDSSDMVTVTTTDGNGNQVTLSYGVSGEKFSFGLPASSNFLSTKQYTPGTDGGSTIHTREVESIDTVGTGRLAWQELR